MEEADEDGFALLDVAIAGFAYGEHEAGEGGEIVALFGGELEKADTLRPCWYLRPARPRIQRMGAALRLSM